MNAERQWAVKYGRRVRFFHEGPGAYRFYIERVLSGQRSAPDLSIVSETWDRRIDLDPILYVCRDEGWMSHAWNWREAIEG